MIYISNESPHQVLTNDPCLRSIRQTRQMLTYGLQVYTAHRSYFDVSIISFTNALAGGGGDCLHYVTGNVKIATMCSVNLKSISSAGKDKTNNNCNDQLSTYALWKPAA